MTILLVTCNGDLSLEKVRIGIANHIPLNDQLLKMPHNTRKNLRRPINVWNPRTIFVGGKFRCQLQSRLNFRH